MNLSPDWCKVFDENGIESLHWSSVGDPAAADSVIMEWAKNNGYIVFTHDLDFGTILAATATTAPSVIQVRTQDPFPDRLSNIFTEDFLKQTGIVPKEWKLAQEPVYNDRVAQIVFDNGVSIVAEPYRVMFAEPIADKSIDSLQLATVARKYVETLKLADYRGMGINFRAHVAHGSSESAAAYLKTRLLAPGGWLGYGNGKVVPKLSFDFDLTDRYLNVSIAEAALQSPEQQSLPVVVFSGNFSYDLSQFIEELKVREVAQIIGNWQRDLSEFTGLIEGQFLAGEREVREEGRVDVAVVPEVFEPIAAQEKLPSVFALGK